MSFEMRNQVALSNTTQGKNFQSTFEWTAQERAAINETLELDTSAVTIGYGNIDTPRLLQFYLDSGDRVELSFDGGSTWPEALSGVKEVCQFRPNIEALREISTITTQADVSDSRDGDYIDLTDRNGTVRLWLSSGTAAAPATPGGGRLLQVDYTTNDTAATLAGLIAAALEADAEFSAVSDGVSLVTITDQHVGTRTDIVDGTTTWTVATTQQGAAAPVIQARSVGSSSLDYTIFPF